MATIHIAYTANDLYAPMCGVSIESLCTNNKQAEEIYIHFLADHVSEENLKKLENTARKYGRTFIVYSHEVVDPIAAKYHEKYGKGKEYIVDGKATYVTYYRLCVPELIKSTDRVLYVGSDTLITGGLEELFQLNMGDYAVAACPDLMNHYYRIGVGLCKGDVYYNDDVLLIQISVWNRENVTDRIFQSAAQNKDLFAFQQQDGLNVEMRDKVYTLPPKYNVTSGFFAYSYKAMKSMYGMKEPNFTEAEYNQAKNKPVICHFAGNSFVRPWFKNSMHPKKKEYDTYYYESEWKDVPQIERKLDRNYRLQVFGYWHLPKVLNDLLGICMMRYFGWNYYRNYGMNRTK